MLEWLKGDAFEEDDFQTFRSKGLGSSDMPIIMGVSPWKTPHKLWLEKTGIQPSDFKGNWATQRGNDLEPMIRAWYNRTYDCNMVVERRVHPEKPHFRCNYDGIDDVNKRCIEIKCGNLEDHIIAHRDGKIPDKYYPQVQFLLWMSGHDRIDYVSYNEKFNEAPFVVVELSLDKEYIDQLLTAAEDFWHAVVDKIPPELSDKDEAVIEDGELVDLVAEYDRLKKEEDILSGKIKAVQQQISSKTSHKKSRCGSWRLTWIEKKGNIDYTKVPALDGVDLESYRRKGSRYFQMKRVKNAEK